MEMTAFEACHWDAMYLLEPWGWEVFEAGFGLKRGEDAEDVIDDPNGLMKMIATHAGQADVLQQARTERAD